MAGAAKASVAEYFANRGTWPANNDAAGIGVNTDIKGKYVDQITIANGGITVTIRLGDANAKLLNATVGLTPGASANGDVVWKCGRSTFTSGAIGAGTTCGDGRHHERLVAQQVPSFELPRLSDGSRGKQLSIGEPLPCRGFSFSGVLKRVRTRPGGNSSAAMRRVRPIELSGAMSTTGLPVGATLEAPGLAVGSRETVALRAGRPYYVIVITVGPFDQQVIDNSVKYLPDDPAP